MARPIPEIHRDLTKLIENEVKKTKSLYDITVDRIRHKSSKHLLIGTISGWVSGVFVVKADIIISFGLGGGILLLHFASEYGYINVNWERVREAANQSQAMFEKLLNLIKNNSCYSVGFLGGFFFGVASM
ncbi:hypothetical protein K1T71_013144 [Dendrolimus kikuchii]|uniref:Uncharacterized protein n=1 Tax=Dendrolimus kikuchii TaxID=765133 RepID=A0ACC1CJH7_9NEOP|nr:hypothetical protein K1T71_013144 [Dendrolimus kikuchii]